MKKTLGGDRLGAGKKMQVNLHNYSRSTQDLGYIFRTTMSAGTLVPFLVEVGLPGDTFDINLNCDIKTHPTVGPLFGSYKVQLDVFQCPIRLYQGALHNNKLGIGMKMNTVRLPILEFQVPVIDVDSMIAEGGDLDNCQINPSAIFSYLGIRGLGLTSTSVPLEERTRSFNGISMLAYWDIYKNYYANKQEETGSVIHGEAIAMNKYINDVFMIKTGTDFVIARFPMVGGGTMQDGVTFRIETSAAGQAVEQVMVKLVNQGWVQLISIMVVTIQTPTQIEGYYNMIYGNEPIIAWRYQTIEEATTTKINVVKFDLTKIDEMRELILGDAGNTAPFNIVNTGLVPYTFPFNSVGEIRSMIYSQEGLAIKTYQSDLLNNWLNTEWIDGTNGIAEITAIDTTSGSFTIDTLNLSRKVYDMLNRIAVSGGTYDDWVDAVYTHDRYTRCESPMYMGGLIKELVFQEVVSNAESVEGQPLGTLAGRGMLAHKHKGGKITVKVDEPSYIIGLVSLTPRIDYSQGNQWDINLETLDDLHKPALDEIGFQELITEQMAWWDTVQVASGSGYKWLQLSAGKQPAWINYMTNVNRIKGNFAIENNEMFMTLTRRYEPVATTSYQATIKDLTTYIDPTKFNHIFAQTSLDSQNFWTQISVDMNVRRKISARVIPNL